MVWGAMEHVDLELKGRLRPGSDFQTALPQVWKSSLCDHHFIPFHLIYFQVQVQVQ